MGSSSLGVSLDSSDVDVAIFGPSRIPAQRFFEGFLKVLTSADQIVSNIRVCTPHPSEQEAACKTGCHATT